MITRFLHLCLATFLGADKGPTAFEHLQATVRRIPAGAYALDTGVVRIAYAPRFAPTEMHLEFHNRAHVLNAPKGRDNRWVTGPQFRFADDGHVASVDTADQHTQHLSQTRMTFLLNAQNDVAHLHIERLLIWDKKGVERDEIQGPVRHFTP